MTDYGEEQRNELEALESIYPDSFTGKKAGRWPRVGPTLEELVGLAGRWVLLGV